jgi:CheY-like chemotaxis protein
MPMYQSILLVDDDVDEHEIFTSALENVSPDVMLTSAASGFDALKILLEKTALPELIFLDINMPTMNGFQFLSELRQHENLKHIPVIIYSTTAVPETIERAKQSGAMGFISKPGDFSELEKILQEVLNSTNRHDF